MFQIPLLLTVLSLPAPALQDYAAPRPTSDNAAGWREHILPSAAETRYEAIPWLMTFGEGVLAAQEQQKPLLFWGMNGHPLGCT